MTERPQDQPVAQAAAPTLLDPASRGVAGLALAVVGLMGQNLVQGGTQLLLAGGPGSGGPQRYFVASAVGALLTLGLALGLAWGPARGTATGWAAVVARAAVVVALVGVVGTGLLLLGGLLSDSRVGLLPRV